MKTKIFYTMLILCLALTACGPAPTPALSADALQATAIANAWAAVTLTQAAIPTSTVTIAPTIAPMTETPFPTIAPLATFPPLQTAVVIVGSPSANPCLDVAPKKPQGFTVKVKFVNKAEAPIDLHFGMQTPNARGECGIYYFSLGKYDQPIVTVLAGCYWAYAYINGPKSLTAKNNNLLCVTDPADQKSITIGKESIGFH